MMMIVQPTTRWMLIAAVLSLPDNSLHCTFTKVAGSFGLSPIAAYNDTTEFECLSKCSVDEECIFLDYNKGLCRTFKSGTDVYELGFNSKAFKYSFDMMETTCRTETVSKPRPFDLRTTTPKHAYPCSDGSENEKGQAITRKNLLEAPDNLAECWYGSFADNRSIPGCTMAKLYFYRTDKSLRHSLDLIHKFETDIAYVAYVSSSYCRKAPFAVAEYRCKGTDRYIAVIDTDGGPNPEFPDFADLERVESAPIFYTGNYCNLKNSSW